MMQFSQNQRHMEFREKRLVYFDQPSVASSEPYDFQKDSSYEGTEKSDKKSVEAPKAKDAGEVNNRATSAINSAAHGVDSVYKGIKGAVEVGQKLGTTAIGAMKESFQKTIDSTKPKPLAAGKLESKTATPRPNNASAVLENNVTPPPILNANGVPPAPAPDQSQLPTLEGRPSSPNAPKPGASDQPVDGTKSAAPEAKADALKPGPEIQKEPTTHGERLDRDLKASMKEFDEAETPQEKFAAGMKVFATLVEYTGRAFKNTLGEEIKQGPKDGEAKGPDPKKPEGADGKSPEEKDKDRLGKELEDRSTKEKEKAKVEKPIDAKEAGKKTETRAENIEGLKTEKGEKIKENAKQITALDSDIKDAKQQNGELLKRESAIKIEMNELQGNDGSEEGMKRLQTKLDTITKQIDAGKEGIVALDNQRDALTAQNKTLENDMKVLDTMKTDVEGVQKFIENVLGKMKITGITFKINPDGSLEFTISGLTEEMKKLLPKDGSVKAAEEGGEKKGEPVKEPEKIPTQNDVQNRRLSIVQGQLNGFAKDGVTIAGNAYTGAEFTSKDGQMNIRYDVTNKVWQVKEKGQSQWSSADTFAPQIEARGWGGFIYDNANSAFDVAGRGVAYGLAQGASKVDSPKNLIDQNLESRKDIINRLKTFNKELSNIQKEEDDAVKRRGA